MSTNKSRSKLSNKNFAIGTIIALVSLVTFLVFLTSTYIMLQGISTVGAIAAITVVLIGIAWFNKTAKT
jgi:hypothetical protein